MKPDKNEILRQALSIKDLPEALTHIALLEFDRAMEAANLVIPNVFTTMFSPLFAEFLGRRGVVELNTLDTAPPANLPIRINCPVCGTLHVDEGEWTTKPHSTHTCQNCGNNWKPALVPTVGVMFLPGTKNE